MQLNSMIHNGSADDLEMHEAPEKGEKPEKGAGPQEDRELFEARIILINSGVNSKLAHMVNTKLFAMERANPKEPIYLMINSPGGEIHSGFAIFDTVRFIAAPVYTIVTGLAASMGSIIALSVPRERRFAFPNSKFLIHQPSIGGGLGGSVSDIEIHAKDLIDTKNHIIDLYAKETGMTQDEVKKALDRDNWMSPQQATKFGLISKIVTKREDILIK